MTYALTLVRLLPLPFAGRLAIAFTEIAIAAVLVSGSVVLGHDLKDWRSWYAAPATNHPWAPTPKPSAIASGATQVVVAPRTVATPQVAAASQIGVSARVAVPLATPAPACETSSGELQLVFVRPVNVGADCVWLQQQSDGTHLLVQATSFTRTDLGVVAMPHATPTVRVFAPRDWSNPVVVVTGPAGADAGSVLVFTWQTRGVMELFRAGGKGLDVVSDGAGWPRVTVMSADGSGSRVRTYGWNGKGFSEQ